MTRTIEELCSIIIDLREQRAVHRARWESVNAEIKCIDDQIDRWALDE